MTVNNDAGVDIREGALRGCTLADLARMTVELGVCPAALFGQFILSNDRLDTAE